MGCVKEIKDGIGRWGKLWVVVVSDDNG